MSPYRFSGSAPTGQTLLNPDRLGVFASLLCFFHCLLTPVLITMPAVFAHSLPSEERTHRFLAVVVASLGALALIRGFRTHGRKRIIGYMVAGLLCILLGAWFGDRLPSHRAEVMVTCLGSILMIVAHRLNHTFCRNCDCARDR
ncbi:MAG TPA: MerC domain-containing protein [Acidobacteriaceae bacterium]|jgi:uncharacterized membrane protein YfcA|nr:MerC domain-containing protein [Acidobacteriaceae bacterium]